MEVLETLFPSFLQEIHDLIIYVLRVKFFACLKNTVILRRDRYILS